MTRTWPDTELSELLVDIARAGMTRTPSWAVETYRGYHISYDPKPIPDFRFDWSYQSDDFDGAPDAGDNRCGHAESLEACKREIDARIEEDAE